MGCRQVKEQKDSGRHDKGIKVGAGNHLTDQAAVTTLRKWE